jgi:hypothetical protein
MMMHNKTLVAGEEYSFRFLQWQDLRMPKGDGYAAMQSGGDSDSFHGV